ncbi:E3 ubiquitin-protein ligase [Heracleum sosnowskyi]|uniref:RING-type E3 ubiquitin transferase n=1 Tax=Heracleum sosnowskyi TaxID=360622 RepID=A0AAD8IAP3_9APIA|nr:E3 ubiquitin-protein ligase [Heracleum sosnowskyi]
MLLVGVVCCCIMGCFCSCFRVPDEEENYDVVVPSNQAEGDVSNKQNCAPLGYLTQFFKNKYGVVSSSSGLQSIPASAQGTYIATREVGANTPPVVQNSSSSRNNELQGHVAVHENGAGSGPLQLGRRLPEGHEVQVNLSRKRNDNVHLRSESKDNAGGFTKDSKAEARCSASPANVSIEKVKTEHIDYFCLTRDEVECPTCLEEYTDENPKITSKCNHNFHLGCIYEWMERSTTCPMCSKVMEFAESI